MNNNIKILLSFKQRGTLVRKSESEAIPYQILKKDVPGYNPKKNKDGNKVIKRGVIPHNSLVNKECMHHINLTEDAYENFISNTPIEGYPLKDWKRMSKKNRLEANLKIYVEYLGGYDLTYEVLED